jgi:dihydroflavonol-4-reductase
LTSARLLHLTSPLDHGKATRELGWQPKPTTDAVRRAARFFTTKSFTTRFSPERHQS